MLPTSAASSDRPATPRYPKGWTGPLFSAILFCTVIAINKWVFGIPSPGVILLLGVIYSTLVGGPVYGIASTLLLTLMGGLSYTIVALDHDLSAMATRLTIFAIIGITNVTVITILQRRFSRLQNARAQEEREVFQGIIDSLHDAVLECDWRGIRNVNPSFCRMTGFARDELVGAKTPFPFWPAEEYARIATAMERAMRGQALDFELVLTRKTGERFPVLLSVSRFNHDANPDPAKPARTVYTFRDISDLKRVQESLAQSERRIAEIIHASDLGLWDMDLATHTLRWNPQKSRMMGLPHRDEYFDADLFWQRVHPDDRDALRKVARQMQECSTPVDYEFRVVHDDGTVRGYYGRGGSIRDAAGKPVRIVGLTFAVTPQN